MTEELFREDAYRSECEATVVAVNDLGGIVLDRTIFYAASGGQPGDSGLLTWDGGQTRIATTVKGKTPEEDIVHVPAEGEARPSVGAAVTCRIDWDRRHQHMRMHTAMHLLCSLLPFGVTGSNFTAEKGRIDFDAGDQLPTREDLQARLNALVDADAPVSTIWITDEELDAQPELVRTLSVQPPRGGGRIRLLKIEGIDLQPCGGTHVAHTGEIGPLEVLKIESKGARNKRVSMAFAAGA